MAFSVGKLLSGVPVIGGAFDDSDQQAIDQLKQNQALYSNINTPDYQQYKPEDYTLAGSYDPEAANATTVSEDPALRSQQQSYLMKLAGLSDTGLSDVDAAGFANARNIADQISRSGTQAAVQNAQARGVGGSGLEFAMREQASQDAAGRAQQAGLDQAAQSAKQRALYDQAYGGALGGVRAQDFSANSANANILNQFNMANTQNRNQAQLYNLGQAQNISNANTTQHNSAQQYNNQLQQQMFNDQLEKANGQSGANSGVAKGYAAENASNTANRDANTGLLASILGSGSGKNKSALNYGG